VFACRMGRRLQGPRMVFRTPRTRTPDHRPLWIWSRHRLAHLRMAAHRCPFLSFRNGHRRRCHRDQGLVPCRTAGPNRRTVATCEHAYAVGLWYPRCDLESDCGTRTHGTGGTAGADRGPTATDADAHRGRHEYGYLLAARMSMARHD